MAGGAEGMDASQFKGLSRYFNTFTDTGRRNISATTLSLVGLFFMYKMMKPKPKPAEPAKKK